MQGVGGVLLDQATAADRAAAELEGDLRRRVAGELLLGEEREHGALRPGLTGDVEVAAQLEAVLPAREPASRAKSASSWRRSSPVASAGASRVASRPAFMPREAKAAKARS